MGYGVNKGRRCLQCPSNEYLKILNLLFANRLHKYIYFISLKLFLDAVLISNLTD